ncbi:hypothetical protein EEB14_20790 [Rhodococcus sp. WS4]|nr:hypothetical protein EEB14_20790 [Rhodococcus sp. WS4]
MDATTREEALELSQELMADIELSRLPIDQMVLKCTRLARIVRDEKASDWLSWERGTIPSGERTRNWRERTRRLFADESENIYIGAVQIVPMVNGWKSQLNQLRVPDASGEQAYVVVGNILSQIGQLRNAIQQYEMILAAVNSEMHNFVVSTHYALNLNPWIVDLGDFRSILW